MKWLFVACMTTAQVNEAMSLQGTLIEKLRVENYMLKYKLNQIKKLSLKLSEDVKIAKKDKGL